MDIIAYLHEGWQPLIRPAPATRGWMDATPESFAYRCLPLDIANAHGWEVLCPTGFEAAWTGDGGTDAVTIRLDADAPPGRAPVSLFGQGVLTFHIDAIIRTPPGWNLMVGGSPNAAKDAIAPLSGVIETDWSPFTFTMNWRFTRPGHWVRFEPLEPICFFFPVQRAAVEAFRPRFADLAADPELKQQFTDWSRARDAFHIKMQQQTAPMAATDRWQKHYYRGTDVSGRSMVKDHRAKLRLKPFAGRPLPPEPVAARVEAVARPVAPPPAADPRVQRDLRRRDWLMEAQERQRQLSPAVSIIERRADVSRDEFLHRYYAPGRPVILTGEMAGWPACERWTPDYLARTVGDRQVEFQDGRSGDERFEIYKEQHRRTASFAEFMARITRPDAGNDAYLTAYNSGANASALAPLERDLGFPDKFLSAAGSARNGMMWIGPAGTVTSLHHDLTNNLVAQVVGSKRLKLIPAAQVGRLYNHLHVFSEIADLDRVAHARERFPLLEGVNVYDLTLEAGEMLFIPLGWWHQVKSLSFSVTLTYTNFLWPNDAAASYPSDA